MGFIIAERLLESGINVVLTGRPERRFEDGERGPSGEDASEELRNLVCTACPFYEHDCDYIGLHRDNPASASQAAVRPCGGLIFLGLLLDRKVVDFTEIRRAV